LEEKRNGFSKVLQVEKSSGKSEHQEGSIAPKAKLFLRKESVGFFYNSLIKTF